MKIGYVRVSKQEQHEALQIDALKEAGCEKWFLDKTTGSKAERKGLAEALTYLRPGDTLVVWKLDRAGRSLTHLIDLLKGLKERNIGFISLTEQIDTTTPGGMLIFHLMGALAEFERDLIRERTNAGLAAARTRGRVGGRPRRLKTSGKVALARRMFADQSHSIPEICAALGISRATLYRYVKETEATTSVISSCNGIVRASFPRGVARPELPISLFISTLVPPALNERFVCTAWEVGVPGYCR